MRSRTLTLILVSAVAAALAAGPRAAPQRATREHQVVVSVLDRDGQTIPGLQPADFTVREDDVSREVLRVETASAPMQIVLLVDTSGGTQLILQDVRKGLQAFAGTIWATRPDSEIALMEFGERPSQLADYARSAAIFDRALGRLFEHSGSGSYLLEAIVDATKSLKKHEAKRPVIVAFVNEASHEFSNQQFQQIETSLKDAKASLWAIVLGSLGGGPTSDEGRNRDVVLGDVTTRSGGARDTLLDRMGVERGYQKLADRLTSQYAVTYGRPESLIPPSRLDVTVKRADAHLLAPRWTGQ
jgi:hypothetical protein